MGRQALFVHLLLNFAQFCTSMSRKKILKSQSMLRSDADAKSYVIARKGKNPAKKILSASSVRYRKARKAA